MNALKIIVYMLAFALFCLASCRKEKVEIDKNEQLGYDYYPTITGKYIIYSVEEITIDAEVDKFDTVRYTLKEAIIDTMASTEPGMTSYKLERYKLNEKTGVWDVMDVWIVKKYPGYLVREEENIPVVKLVFPMKELQKWNAYMFCNQDSEEYELESIDKQDTINTKIFDKVATVIETDFESLFEKRYSVSKYSRNVGIVFSQQIDVESQSSKNISIDVEMPIMKRITKGEITTFKIHNHNFEN